jgi:hypothetical protein
MVQREIKFLSRAAPSPINHARDMLFLILIMDRTHSAYPLR